MARLKLGMWDSAIADCEDCLRLQGDNMKANYYLTQAHLELHNYEEALHYARCAHKLCVQTNDRSMPQATALVLRCKKERWDALEKKRERAGRQLEEDLLALLKHEYDEQAASCQTDVERREVEGEYKAKVEQTEQVFNTAREKKDQRRVVPDWAIDEISFAIFVDPVMVSSAATRPPPPRVPGPNRLTDTRSPPDQDGQELRTRLYHGAPPTFPNRPPDTRALSCERPATEPSPEGGVRGVSPGERMGRGLVVA